MQTALPYETMGLYLSCRHGSTNLMELKAKGTLSDEGPITLALRDGITEADPIFRDDMVLLVVGDNARGREVRRHFRQRTMVRVGQTLIITHQPHE